MQVQCASCQNVAQLDETKVPEGVFKIRCPKCGKIITAEGKRSNANEQIPEAIREFLKHELSALKETLAAGSSANARQTAPDAGPAQPPMSIGQKRALVCDGDAGTAEKAAALLKAGGYAVEISQSVAECIKKIDHQPYALITIGATFADDKEGGKKIIAKVNGKKPSERRKMIAALISPSVKTGDINSGFFEGVNIIVNSADLPSLHALIVEGEQSIQEMYRVFDSVMREKEQKL